MEFRVENSSQDKSEKVGRIALCIALILFVILCDQMSKWMVTELIMRNEQSDIVFNFWRWMIDPPVKPEYMSFEILPFYNIVLVWNYGVSFGMFNNHSPENALLLSGISAVIAFVLMLWMLDTKSKFLGIALALVIGGAFGNIIDRLRFGAVIDFIDVHAAGYHWPAFNLADSCIVVGIAAIIIHSVFIEGRNKNTKTNI